MPQAPRERLAHVDDTLALPPSSSALSSYDEVNGTRSEAQPNAHTRSKFGLRAATFLHFEELSGAPARRGDVRTTCVTNHLPSSGAVGFPRRTCFAVQSKQPHPTGRPSSHKEEYALSSVGGLQAHRSRSPQRHASI